MNNDDVRDFVRQMLKEEFNVLPENFTDDTSMMDSNVIDSLGVLGIVNRLEDRFNFVLPDADFVPRNLDSVNGIIGYLEQHVFSKAKR